MSSISKKESEEEIMRKGMNTFNDLFVEARDQIEMAVESKGTVYYDEDAKSAQEAVDDALKAFDELLSKISESKRAEVKRGTGLKLEQLKQELETTLHADDDHH
jgi:DNA-directed RNA polymerase alpha subunit